MQSREEPQMLWEETENKPQKLFPVEIIVEPVNNMRIQI